MTPPSPLKGLSWAVAFLALAELLLRLGPAPAPVPPAVLRGHPVSLRGADGPVTPSYETRTPPFTLRKPPGTWRVICCGSSSTYGLGLPPQSAWPWRIDAMAPEIPKASVEVINLARVGATSSDQRAIVGVALALQPDCIVLMEGNNEFLPLMAAKASGIDPGVDRERATRSLARVSRIFGWLRALAADDPHETAIPQQAADGLASVTVSDDEIALVRDVFGDNLRAVAHTCRRAGVPLVLCTVPVNRDWPCPVETDRHPVRTRPDFNAVIRQVAAEQALPCCALDDLPAAMFLDACHLNDAGARAVAARVWDGLRPRVAEGGAPALASGGDGLPVPTTLPPSKGRWVDLAQFGDLPSFLTRYGSALPAGLADAVRRAYQQHSTVSFGLADALPPFDPNRTRDLTTLALYGHTLLTAHRYAQAAAIYARAATLDPAARGDLGWARCFDQTPAAALDAWRGATVDRVTQRARAVLEQTR